jgi:hypothetical protein
MAQWVLEEVSMTLGKITRIAILVFSAVLLSAFIGISGGNPTTAGQVPFKGTLFLQVVSEYPDASCPAALRLNISEVGHVTQMGAITATAFVCQKSDLTFDGQFTYTLRTATQSAVRSSANSRQFPGHSIKCRVKNARLPAALVGSLVHRAEASSLAALI